MARPPDRAKRDRRTSFKVRAIHNPVSFGLNYRDLSRDSSPMRPGRTYYVYILASEPNGTLYTGVTNNLSRRMFEHREGLVEGFTTKYSVKTLVYFETFPTAADAIHREKRIKKYPRAWKINLILSHNPSWQDLTAGLV
jgi:putative endonuclease